MKENLAPVHSKFEKITLYETAQLYYLVGSDERETFFRILKIDRKIVKPKSLDLILREDPLLYSRSELAGVLEMINEGNKHTGGLVKVKSAYGLIGFVKFLDCYYVNLITQRKLVGSIGSNSIYGIKATEIFPIKPRDDSNSNAFKKLWSKLNKRINQTNAEIAESRYMGLFLFVDMTKDFFFSYTYDLTRSLQHNYIMCAKRAFPPPPSQDIFEWNYYQTEELRSIVSFSEWILPTIQGSFQQRRFSWFGRILEMALIARRSRHYAGTRYLKRGLSVHGKVANDCEVEQIMQLDVGLDTKFSSYLQMRGSIPTYWFQETSVTNPKPPILLNRRDSSYLASKEHFSDVFKRYNSPVVVLDLVKQQERKPRESLVGKEFRDLVDELNNSIPLEQQIRYCALDYSRITKSNKHKPVSSKAVSGMAGVGQEWAMIESSLGSGGAVASTADDITSGRARTETVGSASGRDYRSDTLESRPPPPVAASSSSSSTAVAGSSGGVAAAALGIGGAAIAAVGGGLVYAGGAVAGGVSTVASGSSSAALTANPHHDVKVDVLMELEDIGTMTVGETGIFCTETEYLEKVGMFQDAHLSAAKKRGYMEQRGVLRTNCIDCLDRTNVAQFAMGIRFLSISLRALGVNNSLIIEPSSPLLMAMMDMFSEMGDRIALQYGGSEAHKKVSGSKASKNGELLTSIKRYYSNAFTDMVKQDAMNVFLGYYVPNEKIMPLWDLESDYFLHNKALRPPVPLENKILFNELKRREPTSGYRYKKISVADGADHNDGEIVLKLLREAPNVDINTVLRHYFFKEGMSESQLSESVAAAIQRSEKRKHVSKEIGDRLSEAVEMWWRDALNNFYAERQWMCLPAPPGAAALSYFERVHRPHELTLFDSVFSSESVLTVDATTKRSPEEVAASKIAAKTAVSATLSASSSSSSSQQPKDDDEEGSGDDDQDLSQRAKAATGAQMTSFGMISAALGFRTTESTPVAGANGSSTTAGSLQGSAEDMSGVGDMDGADSASVSGFFVRKYLRDKVRNLVGGVFNKKDDDGSNSNIGSPTKRTAFKHRPAGINWDQQTMARADVVVSAKSSSMYQQYAACAADPMTIALNDSNTAVDDDFTQSLFEMSISVDSVKAMEQLSADSYVSRVVSQGMYKGMSQLESAIDANVFLFTSLINVEPDLRKCLDEEQISNPMQNSAMPEAYANSTKEQHMKASVTARASLITQKSMSYDSSIRIPEETRLKLFESCLRRRVGFGLESKLQASAARYLFQQVVYARDISIHRLSCRMSSLTSEKTILDYAITFERESIIANLDMITFIATDGPSYQNFFELENLVESLRPLYEKHIQKSREIYEAQLKAMQPAGNPGDAVQDGSNPEPACSEPDAAPVSAEDVTTQSEETGRLSSDSSSNKEAMLTASSPSPALSLTGTVSTDRLDMSVLLDNNKLLRTVNSPEYPGFRLVGPDLYERVTNPFLRMNEIAVIRFDAIMSRKQLLA